MCRKRLLSRVLSPSLSSAGEKAHVEGPREKLDGPVRGKHKIKRQDD